MRRLAVILLLLLAACQRESNVKVIVGATLIDGKGNPLIEHSVVVIEGATIRSVGSQTSVPIPAGSEKIDGAGKHVAPREQSGAIEAGKPAELVLISDGKIIKTMSNGEWVESR